jgi:hypothetical protein
MGRDLLQKLSDTRQVKKFLSFMEIEASLPYSQKRSTGLHPELDESSPHRHIQFH